MAISNIFFLWSKPSTPLSTMPSSTPSPLITSALSSERRTSRLDKLLHQVYCSELEVLHCDKDKKSLSVWAWYEPNQLFSGYSWPFSRPLNQAGHRIPPAELETHCETQRILLPYCFCPFIGSCDSTQTNAHASFCRATTGIHVGNYVAQCVGSNGRRTYCGYLGMFCYSQRTRTISWILISLCLDAQCRCTIYMLGSGEVPILRTLQVCPPYPGLIAHTSDTNYDSFLFCIPAAHTSSIRHSGIPESGRCRRSTRRGGVTWQTYCAAFPNHSLGRIPQRFLNNASSPLPATFPAFEPGASTSTTALYVSSSAVKGDPNKSEQLKQGNPLKRSYAMLGTLSNRPDVLLLTKTRQERQHPRICTIISHGKRNGVLTQARWLCSTGLVWRRILWFVG